MTTTTAEYPALVIEKPLESDRAVAEATSEIPFGHLAIGRLRDRYYVVDRTAQRTDPATTLTLGRPFLSPIDVARRITSSSDAEYLSLVAEHRTLADRRVTEGLDHASEERYQLVRWMLDRIEQSHESPSGAVSGLVEARVALSREIESLLRELQAMPNGRGRRA